MSASVRVTLPDGNVVEVEQNSTLHDVATAIGPGLARAAIGAVWNGELTAVEQRVREDGSVNFITKKSDDAIRIVRHSAAHLLAAAVQELFPDAQLGFGPPTKEGFYYDFVVEEPFTPEDLERIEKRMRKLAKQGLAFERIEMETEEAMAELDRLGYKLKAEYFRELVAAGESISFYRNGDQFSDMCRGPHVKSFGHIPAFRILSASGAYWRGDADGLPMQRIHGTAFPSQAELDANLERIEEAKKRDHLKIGPELDLFSFH
jgi:threonyl-tRNA synthetase